MKIISKITAIALVISVLSVGFCFSVSALVIYDGDFGFEVNTSKRQATLVRYNGSADTVELPDYFQGYPVTVIDRNAFCENKSIKTIVFSNTNTTVEEYAFMNCTSLETVYIPENVVSFGDRAFAGCTSLKNVTLLSDIASVPTNMFLGCTSLENLTINEKISEFGYGCFNGCSALTDLDFVKNVVLLNSYSFNGTGAESVTLSDFLLAIPNNAFTNCPNLTFAAIPASVMLIQPHAFDWENLTIGCYYDSYAYNFAKENSYSYELLDGVKLGDTDADSYISISDVTAIQKHLAELDKLEGIYLYASNVNGDDSVEISDATAIQLFLAEYSVPYPIGEVMTQ